MMSAQAITERHNAEVRAGKPGVGHNSGARPGTAGFAKGQLKAFVERVEKLEEEKKAIADDIRDVVKEAKANGFDTKALRSIVRLRKQDPTEREEQEAILDTYKHALGMI